MTDDLTDKTEPEAQTGAASNVGEQDAEAAAETAAEVPAPSLPTDPAEWRAILSAVSPKDLLRVVQQDRYLSARVLTGFRAAPDTLRRPQVLDRLSKEIAKLPRAAEAVAALSATLAAPSEVSTLNAPDEDAPHSEADDRSSADADAVPTDVPAPPAATEAKGSAALRDTVNRQKTQLREKEARVQELQTALASVQKERDQARAEVETVRAALKAAETENERQKRLREREARKETAPKPAPPAPTKAAPVVPAAPAGSVGATNGFASALEDTLTRLLNRARWETVAEVCREALGQGAAGSPLPPLARGRMHGFYALALYGLGDPTAGEEHDRQAASALLDAGDATGAADALARLLTHATAVKPTVAQLLKRLEPLAARVGQTDAVGEVFRHMRIASPDAYRRLLAALGGGGTTGKRTSLLAAPPPADAPVLGPDDPVLLTPPGEAALSVTPRRVVEAVDSGEEEWVLNLRRALAALAPGKATDSSHVQARQQLLEAVARLQPVAAQPFLHRAIRPVLVDASNVARHDPDPLAQIVSARSPAPARVRHLTQMRDFLLTRGYFPVLLIADATLGFHADDADAYHALVTRHVVYEVPAGTSADEALLSEARLRAAPIVSNDTFSDWNDATGIERFAFDFSTGRVALIPAK